MESTQVKKIIEICLKLETKIPIITQAFQVLDDTNRYIQKLELGNLEKRNCNQFFLDKHFTKIYLEEKEAEKIQENLIRASTTNMSLGFKRAEIETFLLRKVQNSWEELSQQKETYLMQILNSITDDFIIPDDLPESKSLNYNIICNVIIQTIGDLLKLNYSDKIDERQINSVRFKHALGENIAKSLLSLYCLDLGRILKDYIYDKKTLKELLATENINKIKRKINKKYPKMHSDFLKMLILDSCLQALKTINQCKNTYKYLKEYHELFNLKDSTFIVQIHNLENILQSKIQLYYSRIGEDVLSVFITKDVVTKKIIKKKNKTISYIIINSRDFTIYYNRDFPRISTRRLNDNRLEIRKYEDHVLFFKKLNYNIKTSRDGKGRLNVSSNISNVLENSPFNVNRTFVIEFLELFLESIELPIKNLIESTLHLRFISEVFDINLIAFKKTMPKDVFEHLLTHLLDFTNNNKLSNYENYKRLFYKLTNIIYSLKITICEIIYQLIIMVHFEKFYFSWFSDYRLRIYYYSSSLNLSLPFARSFLQFFNTSLIIDENRFKTSLTNQLKSISLLKIPQMLSTTNINLKEILLQNNFKRREAFNYRHIMRDLTNLPSKCESIFSYDATTSGTQMIGLTLRSKNISKLGMLVKNESTDDVYTMFLNSNKQMITDWKQFLWPLLEETLLIPRLNKILENLTQLRKTHFQELYNQSRWPNITNKKLLEIYIQDYLSLLHKELDDPLCKVLENIGSELLQYESIFLQKTFKKLVFNKKLGFKAVLSKLIIVFEMYCYISEFDKPYIKEIYIRNLIKHCFMTTAYGAKAYSQHQMLMRSCLDLILSKGLYLSDSNLISISNFLTYLKVYCMRG